jgi:hypothetical protein
MIRWLSLWHNLFQFLTDSRLFFACLLQSVESHQYEEMAFPLALLVPVSIVKIEMLG